MTIDPIAAQIAAMQKRMAIQPLPQQPKANGIVLPDERSTKQRHYAFCRNSKCAVDGKEFHFEVHQTLVPCPKCGATQPPMVGMLCKTHLLIRDDKGPIQGSSGYRYRCACDPERKRHFISTTTNHEAATDDRTVCNCQDCLIAANLLNAPDVSGLSIV